MKLINPSIEILDTNGYDINGIYKDIERAARVCYKSENNITEDSAKKIVDSLIKREHTSCLEHGTVYLKIPVNIDIAGNFLDDVSTWTKCNLIPEEQQWAITTNYRRIIENNWIDYLQYLCEPTEYHEKRYSVRFHTDIGVTREANRHRVNSPTEQSTRYCNYSKDKFGNELSIILPEEFIEEEIHNSETEFRNLVDNRDCFHGMCKLISDYGDELFSIVDTWLFANLACEWSYMRLIKLGWKPQQARRVLPLDTHSELIHTAFISDWKHFFELRCDKAAHPDMRALAIPLQEEFIKRNIIK